MNKKLFEIVVKDIRKTYYTYRAESEEEVRKMWENGDDPEYYEVGDCEGNEDIVQIIDLGYEDV